jgi:UDP-3-O-[3-hydroxymyristoyl] N-acetylglucosamine deacetylase
MFIGMQKTIENSVSCNGKVLCGEHTVSTVNFLPAEKDMGIVFRRIDLKKDNEIKAIYSNIKKDNHIGITLANEAGAEIFDVEHIMSAMWGNEIDNIIIEVDCPELPDIDGSTEPFSFLLKSGGYKQSKQGRKILALKKEIKVKDKNCEIYIKPSQSFIINMDMNIKGEQKLKESFSFDYSRYPYKDTLSRARSFHLESGMKVIEPKDYRHSYEFAKHEILDCIGAMYLAGYFMSCEINCVNGNYELYSELLKEIFSDKKNYEFI